MAETAVNLRMKTRHCTTLKRWWIGALAAVLVGGCGTAPPGPPPSFDLAAAELAATADAPAVVLDGPSSKAGGVGRSMAKGAGWGLALGLILAPATAGASMFGAVAAVANGVAAVVVGAAGGAVVGAMSAESAAELDAKRNLLASTHAGRPQAPQLVDELTRAAGAHAQPALPRSWLMQAKLVEIASEGSGRGTPFSVRLSVRVEIRRFGDPMPAAERVFDATSSMRRTTEAWSADDAAPLHAALDECRRSLVGQILAWAQPADPGRDIVSRSQRQ